MLASLVIQLWCQDCTVTLRYLCYPHNIVLLPHDLSVWSTFFEWQCFSRVEREACYFSGRASETRPVLAGLGTEYT